MIARQIEFNLRVSPLLLCIMLRLIFDVANDDKSPYQGRFEGGDMEMSNKIEIHCHCRACVEFLSNSANNGGAIPEREDGGGENQDKNKSEDMKMKHFVES
ncbi:hypothetical protein U1Q18_034883 [Sarracenia purpurea var. burkii]